MKAVSKQVKRWTSKVHKDGSKKSRQVAKKELDV